MKYRLICSFTLEQHNASVLLAGHCISCGFESTYQFADNFTSDFVERVTVYLQQQNEGARVRVGVPGVTGIEQIERKEVRNGDEG